MFNYETKLIQENEFLKDLLEMKELVIEELKFDSSQKDFEIQELYNEIETLKNEIERLKNENK